MNTAKTNIAEITRPTKWVTSWGYSYFNGKQNEFVSGFTSRKAAIEALNAAHNGAEILSKSDYARESANGMLQARRATCAYTNYATNG